MGAASLMFPEARIPYGTWGSSYFPAWQTSALAEVNIGQFAGESMARILGLRNVAISELELRNVLRRASTPLVVRNARSGDAYEYGRDYVIEVARRAGDAGMFESPFLRIESFGRISDGEAGTVRLRT